MDKGSRALVKPEGSTYAGARSAHRIHRKEKEFERGFVQKWWPVV